MKRDRDETNEEPVPETERASGASSEVKALEHCLVCCKDFDPANNHGQLDHDEGTGSCLIKHTEVPCDPSVLNADKKYAYSPSGLYTTGEGRLPADSITEAVILERNDQFGFATECRLCGAGLYDVFPWSGEYRGGDCQGGCGPYGCGCQMYCYDDEHISDPTKFERMYPGHDVTLARWFRKRCAAGSCKKCQNAARSHGITPFLLRVKDDDNDAHLGYVGDSGARDLDTDIVGWYGVCARTRALARPPG